MNAVEILCGFPELIDLYDLKQWYTLLVIHFLYCRINHEPINRDQIKEYDFELYMKYKQSVNAGPSEYMNYKIENQLNYKRNHMKQRDQFQAPYSFPNPVCPLLS